MTPPSPSVVAMQEGWEIDSPAPQEQPQGPPPSEPPVVARVATDDPAYYEVQLHVRFLGPPPVSPQAVSDEADEAHWALVEICMQAIKNRPALTFSGIGHGVLRKDI